jgi:hypothetical protein
LVLKQRKRGPKILMTHPRPALHPKRRLFFFQASVLPTPGAASKQILSCLPKIYGKNGGKNTKHKTLLSIPESYLDSRAEKVRTISTSAPLAHRRKVISTGQFLQLVLCLSASRSPGSFTPGGAASSVLTGIEGRL